MTSFSWIWRFQHLKILGKLYSSHVLCPNVAIFLKNVFIFKDRTLKKIILKGRGIRFGSDEKMMNMWFGVWIRDWCGWTSSSRLTLSCTALGLILVHDWLNFNISQKYDIIKCFFCHICLACPISHAWLIIIY